MKPKLYIHIGTYKTGSSMIQYTLYENIEELEKEGIVYMAKENKLVDDETGFRKSQDLNHKYILQARMKLKTMIDEKGSGRNVHFLSSAEEYSGEPGFGFRNADIIAKSLGEITKDFDLDVYIIAYLRRQDDFLESLYTQYIRYGNSYEFQEFIDMFEDHAFDWEFLLRSYVEVFGRENVIARKYHRTLLPEKDSLIRDFGRVIGSSVLENYTGTQTRNEGIPRDALEMLRLVNPYLDEDEKVQLRKIFQNGNAKKPFEKYAFFDLQNRQKILERYEESNSRVAKDFFDDPTGELFPPPTPEENAPMYSGLTTEAVAIQMTQALLVLNKKMKEQKKTVRRVEKLMNGLLKVRNKLMNLLGMGKAEVKSEKGKS